MRRVLRLTSRESGAVSIWGLLLGVAALVAVIGIVVVARRLGAKPAPAPVPGPSARVTLSAPSGEIETRPQEFSWGTVPGASQYRVKIADADAVWPMFVKTTRETHLLLTSQETAAIAPGRVHEWGVEALSESGALLATGGTQFRVGTPIP